MPSVDRLRTPDSCFNNLPGFPYTPLYLEWKDSLRMAYVQVSNTANPNRTYLCIHGEPTWGYLFRRMIPRFIKDDPQAQVIVPDLFGFGRSDKPTDPAWYTYENHIQSLLYFIKELNLTNITLVAQDWGGLLGLSLPNLLHPRFTRLLIMNTSLAILDKPTKGFVDWRAYCRRTPDLSPGKVVSLGTKHITRAEMASYDAPYPDTSYKEGVRRFPELVPTLDDEKKDTEEGRSADRYGSAARKYFESPQASHIQVVMACGVKDPVLGVPVMENLKRILERGCGNVVYFNVPEAGHFVQEWGEGIAERAIKEFAEMSRQSGIQGKL